MKCWDLQCSLKFIMKLPRAFTACDELHMLGSNNLRSHHLLRSCNCLLLVHLLADHFLPGTLCNPAGIHDLEHTRGWLQLQVMLCILCRQLPSAFTALQPAHQLVANPYSKHGCILCC